MSKTEPIFDPDCTRCDRLAQFLRSVQSEHPEYYCRPVPPFGDARPRLLVVGLAPGKHGANASGRPFTGDHAGILLYETLHAFGFANRAQSIHKDDGLQLQNCRITNAVKCLPPENKPTTQEVRECNAYLKQELTDLKPGSVVLALGAVAHKAVLIAMSLKLSAYPFVHGESYSLSNNTLHLLDSYHCSRYNTQTRRLTPEMFRTVFATARKLIDSY